MPQWEPSTALWLLFDGFLLRKKPIVVDRGAARFLIVPPGKNCRAIELGVALKRLLHLPKPLGRRQVQQPLDRQRCRRSLDSRFEYLRQVDGPIARIDPRLNPA